jgi:hypothetical protein
VSRLVSKFGTIVMTITRDPGFPVETANLFQAFNMTADGFDANTVLNASMQMVAASIGYLAKAHGMHLQQALDRADQINTLIKAEVANNWDRKPEATDVEVNLRNARAL